MNKFARDALKVLGSALFPDNIYCICCGDCMDKSRLHGLCDSCAEKLPWAFENPYSSYMDEFAFDCVWPCIRYGFYARRIMNAFKQQGRPYMAENIGLIMAQRMLMEEELPDFIVAVPSHRSKEKRRGYNQAELLACACAKYTGIKHLKGALVKKEDTPSMRKACGRERRSMLLDSFAVDPLFARRVEGGFICLADDVTTTGSTADACAKVLKGAGAKRVALLCFAASSGHRESEEAQGQQEKNIMQIPIYDIK